MRTSFFVLLLIAVATSAHAQALTSGLFVEGAVLGDYDSSRLGKPNPPASVGGGGTIGFQAGYFTARFEAEVPAFHSGAFSDESFRTITYGAQFGGRFQPYTRVELAALAGFADTIEERRYSGDGISSRYSYHGGAVTAGVDVAVRVTSHLSLVPEFRCLVYSEYGSVFRPKLAVRWAF